MAIKLHKDAVITMDGIDDLINDFSLYIKNSERILNSSINRAMGTARTASIRHTVKDWAMLTRDFKGTTKTDRATKSNNNTGKFTVTSKPISLINFSGKQFKPRTKSLGRGKGRGRVKGRAGVSFKLKKGQKPTKLKNSWIAQGKFGNAIWREDPADKRRRLYMASITPTSMFKQEGVDIFIKTFETAFVKRYKHNIKFLTDPANNK